MQPKRPIAFSYVRFSTMEQAGGDSLRRQTQAAEAYAATHGLELAELTLHDLGRSAYRGKNLAEGALFMFRRAVEDGDVPADSYLLIESPDRLSRLPAIDALTALSEICKLGITVVTLDDGQQYDRQRMTQEFMVVLKWLLRAEVAHDESKKKGYRVAKAWSEKRRNAATAKLTAICPHWLRLSDDRLAYEIIEDRAAVARRILEEALEGRGQEAIARGLNRDAIPTFGRDRKWKHKEGSTRWHKSMVAKVVRSEAVVGTYQPHRIAFDENGRKTRVPDGPAIEGYFPAIIDTDTFATLTARLDGKRAPYVRRGQAITNPLAGIARCGLCGSSMTQVAKGNRSRPVLVCSRAKVGAGCSYHSVPVEEIWAALHSHPIAGTAPKGNTETQAAWERLEAARHGTVDHVTNLTKAIAEGGHSVALMDALAEAERELAGIEASARALADRARVETAKSVERRLGALQAALDNKETSAAALNTVLRENLSSVTVFPADPVNSTAASIAFLWLQGGQSSVPLGGFGKAPR
ncbi:recombinase family protein [Devosia sp.]|uniref:recombinase family protein n=1 Tax=Devosia sp. TaxID=1871048 RepID=UPI003BAC3FF0